MSATHVRGEVVAPPAEPHHDGSDLCVLERPDELGGETVLRLRARRGAAEHVLLRYERDGEPRTAEAEIDEESETETWWRAELPLWNPTVRYRWLLAGGEVGYGWLNGLGLSAHEVPGSDDFVASLGPGGPAWHLGSVVYEIFPDRFARSTRAHPPAPEWSVERRWDAPPTGRGPSTPRELYGGDLWGVEEHLDHVERVGANAIYLTPFFPAHSTHRYDATTFEHVDPLLGGDRALESLARAAHARGIRLIGDLTLNHTGDHHEWFPVERDFYYFDDALPAGYEAWLGVPSLPKLNWSSPRLRERMAAVLDRFDLDGWRIDVANMIGRFRDTDLNAEVARWARSHARDRLLVAEHGHDFRPDLDGRGWHGVMNYSGFLRPVWWWLRSDELTKDVFSSAPAPRYGGADSVAVMRSFRAGVPWDSVLHSWTLLDSHDTARFRTVCGSRARHLVGIGLQMTTPGVPMIFAGDELGLEGRWGEDGRRTMPWADEESWDTAFVEEVRRLAALRRSSEALARGGIRYVHLAEDALSYVRETRGERILCLAARAPHAPIRVPFTELETLYGEDACDGVLPSDGPAFHVWRIA
jgi:alpha-glucosidase